MTTMNIALSDVVLYGTTVEEGFQTTKFLKLIVNMLINKID